MKFRIASRLLATIIAVSPLACEVMLSASPGEAAAAARAGLRRFPIDAGEYTGLSDLTIDAAGHFWAAPERQRVLLRLNLTGDHPGIDDAPIPIDGIPEGTDTEAMVWLSPGRFAIGTENQIPDRPSDAIYIVAVEGGRAHVTQKLAIPYRLWHMRARANNGIEGICFAGNNLLVSVETAGREPDGARFAPLGRYDIATRVWTPFELLLTSHIGKISALTCRAEKNAQEMEVLAIERHFGISRLLRFTVPLHGPKMAIKPEVLLDFGKVIDAVPNLEGITWSPQQDMYVISDNDFGIVTGPTQIVVVPRGWH